MDTLTHALSGAVVGRATAGLDGSGLTARRRIGVGFMAAAFPDIDFVLQFVVDPVTFLNLHRGVTHSLLILPFWALLLAWLFVLMFRDGTRIRDYYPLAAMALAIHIAGDVITSYGTQVFAPLSDYALAIPTTFIIDPWFTGILLAGLLVSWAWRESRWPATAALAVLVGYVGFQGLQLYKATQLGVQYAAQQGFEGARASAMPQPLSPFNWRVFVEHDTRYEVATVNLRRSEPPEEDPEGFIARLRAGYRPPDDLRWHTFHQFGDDPKARELARAAWDSEAIAGYRAFARFPYSFDVTRLEQAPCAWFVDLRFTVGDPPLLDRAPFQYGACRQEGVDGWQLYRYGPPPEPIS